MKLIIFCIFISFNLSVYAYGWYYIEHVYNDELFIINGEKFEAKTYCLGWDEGNEVKFVEGSPYGVCTSALIYNKTRNDTCSVWCE